MVEVSMRARILLVAFAAVATAQFVRADSPSVTAVLSNSEAVVDQTVELQIKVTGPGDAQPPEEISVDGLEIHATGQSRQFEIHNFATSSSVTYNYTILPLKAGRFRIPPRPDASRADRVGARPRRWPTAWRLPRSAPTPAARFASPVRCAESPR